MSLSDFISKYTGQANVGDTPENTGQCVGLISVWLDNLNLNTPHLYGNAKDLLNNADQAKFDVIYNTPTGVPQAGDVIVWGDTWGGGFGHTGIFCSGDTNSFNCFEQNDPAGSTPHAKQYTYSGVLGWLHPKSASDTDPLAVCLQQHTQLVDEANKKDTQIASLQTTISSLNQQVIDLSDKISTLQSQPPTSTPAPVVPISTPPAQTPPQQPIPIQNKTLQRFLDWIQKLLYG